jgi:hypothetical protein
MPTTEPAIVTHLIERGKSRLFEPIFSFLTLYDCIGIAVSYFARGRAQGKLGDYGLAYPNQFPLQVKHITRGLVESALARHRIDGFPLTVEPKGTPPTGFETDGFQDIVTNAISPTFIAYFENQRPWLDSNVSTDTRLWPPIWQFARVVRNAASHGGTLNWLNDKAPPVSWYHLTYSAKDRGKLVVGGDLILGDLLILMLEMDKELDHLGCPI